MTVEGKSIVVTGGSRGLGLGLVEMLSELGANVTVVARDPEALAVVGRKLAVKTMEADVTDQSAAIRIVAEIRPDVLVLNAGVRPPMGRLDEISWTDFTETWNSDVKAGLYWIQAALNTPLRPGSKVTVVSSGAAVGGSPLSGGYAGAKRMLWTMCKYANGVAEKKALGLCFQAVLPLEMIAGTGVGDTSAKAYADEIGVTPAEFLSRFGSAMPPRDFGAKVIAILEEPQYGTGLAFGLKGGQEITLLEEVKK